MAERDPSVAALSNRLSRRQWLTSAAALAITPAALARPMAAEAQSSGKPPKPGGTSVWAAETDPVALNPITNSNFSSTQGFEHCYESLTAFDAKAQIVPALAERWDTPNPTTYVFHLRRGVKFHDGGEFTAEDVKYTFDIVLDPKGPAFWRGNFDQVDRVEAVDRHTVRFTTKAPFPPLLGALAILRSSAIIPKGAMEKLKLETQVIGTGPYRLVEYVPKSHIKLRKNPDYWGRPLPYLDEVTFRILEEEDARVAGLRAGSLDYAFLTPEGVQRLRNEPRIVVSSRPRTYLYAFVINRQRKPWSDPRARQALSLATDRQEIIEKVFSGGATMAGPIPFGFGDWYLTAEELQAKWYRPDLAKAKALLREAGVPDGHAIDLLVTPFNQNFPGLAVVFADQLKRIGLNVTIRQVEQGVFLKEVAPPTFNYDIQANAYTARHDPDGYVYNGLHSQTRNAAGYSNPKLDELLTKARTTIDRAQRKTMYREIQQILLDDAPNVWLGNDNVTEGLQSYVKGYEQSPYTYRAWGLRHAWLDK
ncbi:MAG TPA: ABC transporter substrate-binding protein [Methylomirabilota bacterium]|nr:ABC transporter substrate-binding protein [Methylomirabilota bacterium]